MAATLSGGDAGAGHPDGLRVAATLTPRSFDDRLAPLALPAELLGRARQAGRHAGTQRRN